VTRLVRQLVSELSSVPPSIDAFRGAVGTSLVSGGRLQPLEVIDVVLNSSGLIVCNFCRWLGPIVGSCTGDNHRRHCR
jgi:hypothetical protein